MDARWGNSGSSDEYGLYDRFWISSYRSLAITPKDLASVDEQVPNRTGTIGTPAAILDAQPAR